MIKRITIKGYRCFNKQTVFEFESGVNLLIGENDSGKSSVFSCIRLFDKFSDETIDDEIDFARYISETEQEEIANEIYIEIETTSGCKYEFSKQKAQQEQYKKKMSLEKIKDMLEASQEEELTKDIYKFINGSLPKGSTNRETKKTGIITNIQERLENGESFIESIITKGQLDLIIAVFDGKNKTDINQNFHKYITPEVSDLWDVELNLNNNETKTIRNIIDDKLSEKKQQKQVEYQESLLPELQALLPGITGIEVDIKNNFKSFNQFDSRIDFKNSRGQKISVDNKGEGTKRRISLALFKNEKKELSNAVFLFDEPDTHLHIRAQQDLFIFFEALSVSENQIIIASHSPFFMNLINLKNINLIKQDNSHVVQRLDGEIDGNIQLLLNELGIANLDIFFSRYFIIFEGQTEEKFFRKLCTLKQVDLYKKFVKIIDCEGVSKVGNFVLTFKNFLQGYNKVYLRVDTDYEHNDERTAQLINDFKGLGVDYVNFDSFGTKEFEDMFQINDVYNCFQNLIEINETEFTQKATRSTKISKYYSNIIGLSKDEIGEKLAEYYFNNNLSIEKIEDLMTIFNSL